MAIPLLQLHYLSYWAPFLVKADFFEDFNGVSTSEVELYLDKLDKKWTDQYQNLDYMIISSGKWFLKSSLYHEGDFGPLAFIFKIFRPETLFGKYLGK